MKRIVFGVGLTVALSVSIVSTQAPYKNPGDGICQTENRYDNWSCIVPIILPLSADKRALTRDNFEMTDFLLGVRFDVDGDGIAEQVAWTALGSHLAFLAIDRNGNGKIDDGKELISNHSTLGWHSGFEALRYESNGVPERQKELAAGWGNPVFDKLLLWEDENHDGISQPEEIHKFSDHYLAIDPLCVADPLTDKWGNQYICRGAAAVKEGGMTRMPYGRRDLFIPIYDVVLRGR